MARLPRGRRACAALIALALAGQAQATGWDSADPKVIEWFKHANVTSCCGEGDGYEADFFESEKGGVVATVTDDNNHLCRDSWDEEGNRGSVCKAPIPPDFKPIHVPQDKLRYEPRNPTGHGVIFLRQDDFGVICYWLPSGG